MDFGNALGFAWSFARNRERVGLFFLLILGALAGLGLLCLLFVALAGNALGVFGAGQLLRNPAAVPALVGGFAVLALLFVVFVLLLIGFWLWATAAIMKSAANEYSGERAPLRECIEFAKTRFWTLVLTIVLVAIISMLVSLPFSVLSLAQPFVVGAFFGVVAFLVRLILGLALFFAQYSAVVGGTGAAESVRESVNLFLKRPLEVFLVAVLLIIAAIVLLIAACVPTLLLALLALGIAALVGGVVGLVLCVLIGLIALLVFLVGIAFLEVFLEGFATAAFLDLSGARPSPPSLLPAAAAPRAFAPPTAAAPRAGAARPALKRPPASRRRVSKPKQKAGVSRK
jgi:hypothetical protein